ncbi:MAG TPA: helix-turn-helix transcriptional regulator [Labilithrix sp.]|nr:helix-turn-helix transcriptional regulator [Labilithrix sp.]
MSLESYALEAPSRRARLTPEKKRNDAAATIPRRAIPYLTGGFHGGMLTPDERKKLVGEVSRFAFDATSPEALACTVMKPLHRLVDASASVLYRINDQGNMLPLGGSLMDGAALAYSRECYAIDPLQAAMRSENPWVFRTERSADAWQEYLDGPVYRDLCRHAEVHSYLHVRLVDCDHGTNGMYAMMLAHSERQAPFGTQDELDLIEVLPTLEAAIRRTTRAGGRQGSLLAIEAALDSSRRPSVVMDARGGLLWASKRARRLLGWDRGRQGLVPNALREGALELGALVAGKRPSARPTRTIQLVGLDGEHVAVEFRTAQTEAGLPVIVAELDLASQPSAADLAKRFNLTTAQANVLASLADGCSDRSIGERHSISLATVRSHIGQILSKLGVESRLQAALLAARCPSSASENDDDDDVELPLRPRGPDA